MQSVRAVKTWEVVGLIRKAHHSLSFFKENINGQKEIFWLGARQNPSRPICNRRPYICRVCNHASQNNFFISIFLSCNSKLIMSMHHVKKTNNIHFYYWQWWPENTLQWYNHPLHCVHRMKIDKKPPLNGEFHQLEKK